MSTTSKRSLTISNSFDSPYVSPGLLPYLEPGQMTPFQVFNEVVMPDFLRHFPMGKQLLPSPEIEGNHVNGIDTTEIITEEDFSGGNYHSDMHAVVDQIHTNLNHIKRACGRLERWETEVNCAIKDLILQSLDDNFKERTERSEMTFRTYSAVQRSKLIKTAETISNLKNFICSPPELTSIDLDSDSFKRSNLSMTRKEINLCQGIVNWPIELPVVNISRTIACASTFEEILATYSNLEVTLKLCLLCFSVFPENAIIKKKVLVHWWVGEGFIDSSSSGGKTVEEMGNGYFKDLIAKRIIEPVYKKRRPGADSCKMEPSIRYAVIMLAERAGFINFDCDGNPTANFSDCRRACLVRTGDGSSVEELTYSFHLKQGNIETLFNVSEPYLNFDSYWFSKMKYVKVLQLGRWKSSVKHLIEVKDSEFLKGLKYMKHLRYLSLRGVSRITELPESICKLSNLRILNLNGCRDLEKLPDGIGLLEKLTHLDMYECYLISHMPKGLALLSELQVLKGFVIGEPNSGSQYCKLGDLTKLEKLKTLRIHVDKKSTCTAERELSCLGKFKNLRSLSISWSRIYDSSIPQKGLQRMISKTLARSVKSIRHPRVAPASQSPTVPLEKLNLHYFPHSVMPEWLMPGGLKDLKKLYIRGGELSNLRLEDRCQWTVKVLRLKFLSQLKMDWPELRALFPNLVYMEKFNCPQLSFLPCDESGVWKKGS
ncbi:hypothetical protein FNV43_RR07680 [Rhamnella rubrinervis]|uniref:Disease resistance RPP13-like protein 4 n=1 Tax=Rhamnella rubrinervis TaxID=2594499 RepID=A0A8K0HFU5_9ROSA|nr:hypothetical protein FNV43_RR07680 [Rhamnella rubrinervis]